VKVTCENGLCRPVKSEGYNNTCKEICGETNCDAAVLPVDCDFTKQKFDPPLGGEKNLNLCFNSKSCIIF